MGLVKRYSNKYTLVRGYAHFLLTGVITAFCMPYIPFIGLVFPVLLEIVQFLFDDEWDWEDGLWDAAEGLAGGVTIGLIFYGQDLCLGYA
jgi:hypothetical protein